MKVAVHIDRLIVEGEPLGRRERAALVASIERELRERIDGAPRGPQPGALGALTRPQRIAAEVATAVHGQIARPPAARRAT